MLEKSSWSDHRFDGTVSSKSQSLQRFYLLVQGISPGPTKVNHVLREGATQVSVEDSRNHYLICHVVSSIVLDVKTSGKHRGEKHERFHEFVFFAGRNRGEYVRVPLWSGTRNTRSLRIFMVVGSAQ